MQIFILLLMLFHPLLLSARKIVNLKLFSNGESRWKKSVKDENLEILCVSQVVIFSFARRAAFQLHLPSLSKYLTLMMHGIWKTIMAYCQYQWNNGRSYSFFSTLV